MGITYKDSGVDIDSADILKRKISNIALSTYDSNVLAGVGPFGAIVKIPQGFNEPVIVFSCDGVGTKLKIASIAKNFKGVGIDLVAMCANDILAMNAKPFVFLDYVGLSKLEERVVVEIMEGVKLGCIEAGCSLIGGETAQMPSFYEEGAFELVGFCSGIAEKKNLPNITKVAKGDVIIGLQSSGLHSNGFSLIRKILDVKKYSLDFVPNGFSETLAEILLKPTKIYVRPVLATAGKFGFPKACAHITGGGIPGNIIRILPEGKRGRIYQKKLSPHTIFDFVRKEGEVNDDEMFRVFNMGLGFAMIYPQNIADSVVDFINEKFPDFGASIVGTLENGDKGVIIED
jgi:phosphoribosylformylglycinamidine cyclo-ligase